MSEQLQSEASRRGRLAKTKGNAYERKIARVLSDWWEPGKHAATTPAQDLPFCRTPMSGGHRRFGSDLIVPNDFPLYLEMKDRRSWRYLDCLLLSDGPMSSQPIQWLTEEEVKSEKKGKKPVMLVFHRPGDSESFVMLREQIFESLVEKTAEAVEFREIRYAGGGGSGQRFSVLTLKSWMRAVSPDACKALVALSPFKLGDRGQDG